MTPTAFPTVSRFPMSRTLPLTLALLVVLLATAAPAGALASHDGWPPTTMLLMNKTDRSRPLDARPGFDPFGGRDPNYRCDSIHGTSSSCAGRFERHGRHHFVITSRPGHEPRAPKEPTTRRRSY